MAREKLIRLSKVKEDLKFHGVEMTYTQLVEYIEENYSYIKISKTPHLSTVPQRIAVEMIKEMGHPIESTRDAREHIYLLLPSSGTYMIPYNVKDRKHSKPMTMGVTAYGTVDLAEYAKKIDEDCTVRDVAEYLIEAFHAKEITYEEFKSRAVRGKAPQSAFRTPPVDLTRTDKWEKGDSHLEILAGREEVDESTIKGLK